jgi:NADH-quinone oxidoreductase subunit K
MHPQQHLYIYQAIAASLFVIGTLGVITRRNVVVIFMCIELMLNAVNLSLVSFSRYWNDPDGAMLVFFVMCVAAAEAVVGLAIVIALFRNKQSVDVKEVSLFKW